MSRAAAAAATRLFRRGLRYFKRSFVKKDDGGFEGWFEDPLPPRTYPMAYSVSDAYLHAEPNVRDLDVVCTLRVGAGRYPARARALRWARRWAASRNASGFLGEVDTSNRDGLSDAPVRRADTDESRRRRGRDVDSPWRRVAATPRLRRG